MIVRLDKAGQREERRKLLQGKVDVVYAICHDALKGLLKEGRTAMSAVEVFLSARTFVSTMLEMGDLDEALEDELDDLEEDAEGENDAVIIMMVVSALFMAVSKRRIGFDAKSLILRIYARCQDHELFFPMLDRFSEKEQARWAEGKRTDLFAYELEHLDAEGGGSNDVRELLSWFATICDKLDADSVKGLILALGKYNNDHAHVYTKEIDALYEKLGIKGTPVVEGDLVMKKEVQYEVNGVAEGGTGVSINDKQ